jgi:hydrogenase nickel incorporation protein HypA/HybF
MHEMSLIEDVIGLVEQERAKQAFDRVRLIRLELGALGCVEPQALRFCFDAVAQGTIAEGARLDIQMVAGQGWCPDCRLAAPLAERFSACPRCDGARMRITAGDGLRLAEMEVE